MKCKTELIITTQVVITSKIYYQHCYGTEMARTYFYCAAAAYGIHSPPLVRRSHDGHDSADLVIGVADLLDYCLLFGADQLLGRSRDLLRLTLGGDRFFLGQPALALRRWFFHSWGRATLASELALRGRRG